MDDDERVHASLRNEVCADDRFPECGRRGEDAGVVAKHGLRRLRLVRMQLAGEFHVEMDSLLPLIVYAEFNSGVVEKAYELGHTAAGKRNVLGIIFGAADDARLTEGGHPHGLRAVEFRILEGRQSNQPVS